MNAGKSARAPLSFVFAHPRYVTSVWRILRTWGVRLYIYQILAEGISRDTQILHILMIINLHGGSAATPSSRPRTEDRNSCYAAGGLFSPPRKAGPSILQELCRRVLSVAAAVGVGILALRMAIGKRMS